VPKSALFVVDVIFYSTKISLIRLTTLIERT